MNKLILTLILCASAAMASAQTTALNFTKNDCAGTSHDLFTELDSGYVCVIEFIMTGCQPCIAGGNALKNIVNSYTATNPNKVRLYSMGYNNNYTCTQLNSWKAANGFAHPIFAQGAAQVTHYGGMGMPTIAIVAGNAHQVLYVNQGYSTSENQAITNAITAGIALTVSTQNVQNLGITAYPTLVQNTVNLQGDLQNIAKITLVDMQGKTHKVITNITQNFGVNELQAGIYILKIETIKGEMGQIKIAKQ